MAAKFLILFVCLLFSVVTGLPLGEGVAETTYEYSEHVLSGASGTFRFPLSGSSYGINERVTIIPHFPANTLFIIEDYSIESSSNCAYDRLSLHRFRGTAADSTFCGRSTGPKYFKTVQNFLVTFASDVSLSREGFNLRWVPIE